MANKKYERGLFLFHRDLRIKDNIGLLAACSQCKKTYTTFIFTPEQVGKSNSYKSDNAVQFMIESLEELGETIHSEGGEFITLYGKTTPLIKYLISELNIDCVFFNRDYTPYALKRDSDLQQLCTRMNIKCETYQDYYLHEPGTVKNGQNGCFHKFTPYYEKALDLPVDKPSSKRNPSLALRIPSRPPSTHVYDGLQTLVSFASISPLSNEITLKDAMSKMCKINPDILVHGGRNLGIKRLKAALNNQAEYATTRDNLFDETTRLSAYIKFGCVSIREVYNVFLVKFGKNNEINRQLIWRDFFAQLLYAYPNTLGHSYYPSFEKIHWKTNQDWLNRWKTGTTGFPVVDACMRELNTTGYMHNRGRMIVATFLVKTLLLDWREGEQYFAKKLIDYDVASNNGNWSAIVGGGAYSMPYFRIMNPWIQSFKFDRETKYIKRWVPELKYVLPKDIHQWSTKYMNYKTVDYFEPMVDYQEQKEMALELYNKYV